MATGSMIESLREMVRALLLEKAFNCLSGHTVHCRTVACPEYSVNSRRCRSCPIKATRGGRSASKPGKI